MELKKMIAQIEAILFTLGNSVKTSVIAEAIGHDEETVKKIIHKMMDDYDVMEHGIGIIEFDGSFQMCTKAEMYETLVKVAHVPKRYQLTDSLLEVLSIIAYKQPVTKLDIEQVRGVKCDHAVNKLIEFGLIEEVGRLPAPGRPIVFGTSEEFLRHFGIRSLEELPEMNSEKQEEFMEEVRQEVQMSLEDFKKEE